MSNFKGSIPPARKWIYAIVAHPTRVRSKFSSNAQACRATKNPAGFRAHCRSYSKIIDDLPQIILVLGSSLLKAPLSVDFAKTGRKAAVKSVLPRATGGGELRCPLAQRRRRRGARTEYQESHRRRGVLAGRLLGWSLSPRRAAFERARGRIVERLTCRRLGRTESASSRTSDRVSKRPGTAPTFPPDLIFSTVARCRMFQLAGGNQLCRGYDVG